MLIELQFTQPRKSKVQKDVSSTTNKLTDNQLKAR